MRLFTDIGVDFVPHFAPLHYLPFIARSKSLLSKRALSKLGYADSHFRSRSKNTDIARGFGGYAFLTLSHDPEIIQAKLKGGFPHISIRVPVSAFDSMRFDLCRYNVAMARRTTDSPTGGFKESDTNGRYYGDRKIPIARSDGDKIRMLRKHYPIGTMIEVLVHEKLPLPNGTEVHCFSEEDHDIAKRIINGYGLTWGVYEVTPPGVYNRNQDYAEKVLRFIERTKDDEHWRGDGLEFDRV
ncbi:MAG: hypothetical protein AAF465_10010 [Pseudomonadota bacterium]